MIINRYIYREILQKLFWIFSLLILIFTTHKFVDYLGDAATGKIPTDYIFKLLWLHVVAMQTEVLPLILFLSVILAFARLNQDNELIIFSVSGLGKLNQIKITLRFTLLFCLLVSYIFFSATPRAKENIKLLKKQAWQEASISAIKAGQFKEINKGNSVVYVEEITGDRRNMKNVFLQLQNKGKNNVIRSGKAGFDVDKQSGNRFLVFEEGIRYVTPEKGLDYQITKYKKYGVLIGTSDEKDWIPGPESISTLELLKNDNVAYLAELQWRISAIIACILLTILAVLLNQHLFNLKTYTLFLAGILIYIIYTNLMGISRALLEKDKISPWLGLWWVHLLLIVIILIIHYYPDVRKIGRKNTNVQVLHAE